MSAPEISYERQHPGCWNVMHSRRFSIGRIVQEEDTGVRSLVLDGLLWTDGKVQELNRQRGRAVRVFPKNTTLGRICNIVAICLGRLEESEAPPVVTPPPVVKPKITVELEEPGDPPGYQGRKLLGERTDGVTLSRAPFDTRIRLDAGFGHLLLSPEHARQAWELLGEYLGQAQQRPDGGTIRNGGTSYPSDTMKAREAVRGALDWMWRMTHQVAPTEVDLKRMAWVLKDMAS